MKKTSTIYREVKHPLKNLLKADLAHFNIDLYAKVEAKEYISFPLPSAFVVKHRKKIADYIQIQAELEGMNTVDYIADDFFLGDQALEVIKILFFGDVCSELSVDLIVCYAINEVRTALTEAVGQAKRDAEVKAAAAANRKDNARMIRRLNHA